ncbi:MAG: DUF3473 domain-containing protein [candidate division KSB1 bacterium]|nr:DUF3473 domain-containing protein [candidate division KSB1 bacterium]
MSQGRPKRQPVPNALTVDVEDWIQSTYDRDAPIGERVVQNTGHLLQLLDELGVRGTFFVQGLVAERFPQLVKEILRRGHELACHGYSHKPVFLQSGEEFVADVARAQNILTDVSGIRPSGYRAPDFSIVPATLWALERLADLGFAYDSSVFPFRGRRYGIPSWESMPKVLTFDGGKHLVEFPLPVLRVGWLQMPFLGGGYSRLFPLWLQIYGIRKLNASGRPAVLYVHPYELNPWEMDSLPIPRFSLLRAQQNAGRSGLERKLRVLLRLFPFAPAGEVLRTLGLLP